MNISYKNICKFQRDKFPEQIRIAQDFLRTIYPDANFDRVEYIYSSNCCRSRYFANEIPNGKYINPVVRIANRSHLWLYEKRSLKLKRYDLKTGNYIQVICALVHELTHHIQHCRRLGASELETTKNEVEFLRINYPELYKQLI